MYNDFDLKNLNSFFPKTFSSEELSQCQTYFYKKLSYLAHSFYSGKMQTIPKVPISGINWFNIWYTPGVSEVSTSIRDNNLESFRLSNRSNLVAVVSDSTRVLGDGDCTPSGGLGVMEGKAMLMKYLGGIDAFPLCIDSKDEFGENSPDKIIQFVKMCQHSFGAINLEDISQPNCYKVLDVLSKECDIPVWHDDAQGTACVTIAGLINALKLVNKNIKNIKIVLFGAGAANSTIAQLLILEGANPQNIIIFDKQGSLNINREDYKKDLRYYKIWELCKKTNPHNIINIEDAFKEADVLIALSTPGPNTIKPHWIKLMNEKPIIFACANPIPEIYPYQAKEAGAYIVATGRGDFANQVNNSIGFPGILKGALLSKATKITDNMTLAAAHSLSEFAFKRGIDTENIIPRMDETEVFAIEAAVVATQAIKDKVARYEISYNQALEIAKNDIDKAQKTSEILLENNIIENLPSQYFAQAVDWAINKVVNK